MIDTDCSWWYTNRQNWYTVVCILIECIILYGIILHVYHYIRRSFLTDPSIVWPESQWLTGVDTGRCRPLWAGQNCSLAGRTRTSPGRTGHWQIKNNFNFFGLDFKRIFFNDPVINYCVFLHKVSVTDYLWSPLYSAAEHINVKV